MKPFILIIVCISMASYSYSQCAKRLMLESNETHYLDSRGATQRTVEEKSTVEITNSEVTILAGDNPPMKATIKSDTCNWPVPYKEGKSVLKVAFAKGEHIMPATITIEGKDGKTTFLMEIDGQLDRKIRLFATSFQEKN